MPISEKITDEIKKLDAEQKEKELLLKMLNMEDGGMRNFTLPYENAIKEYLAMTGEENK